MKTIYIICIEDKKNKSKFNSYILTSTTNLCVAERIIETLSDCVKENFNVYWQQEYIEL